MTKVYIEAGAIAETRTSGIGNTVLNIVKTLAENNEFNKQHTLHLLVAFNKVHLLEQHGLPDSVKITRIFIPGKVMNLITRFNLMPPMDIFFGRGLYIFPNFKNWPLIRSRSITYIHDIAFLRHPEYIEARNLTFLNRNIRLWVKRTSVIITVSRHAAKEIGSFFPDYRYKIRTVYNGIDKKLFYPRDQSEQESVCHKYGLRLGNYYIFLSNLEPRKNIDGLLDGFKAYCDEAGVKNKEQLMLIGGMGWSNEAVKEKIHILQKQGYLIIRPEKFVEDSDLPALLSASAGLIHPAFYEGFGLSPLQAMACGKNVVVGDNSSLPEVVGRAGKYINPHDTKEIAEGFRFLAENKNIFNQQGFDRALTFEWKSSLEPLCELVITEGNKL